MVVNRTRTIKQRQSDAVTIENITYIEPTREVLLSTLELMSSYRLASIFDAIYAATVLTTLVPYHIILSTDMPMIESQI